MNFSMSTYSPTTSNPALIGAEISMDFTGKERDEETGYHYFGARYYDSEALTGWLSVDPMSDKYPSLSPYNYCAWNPIKVMDPNGMDTININLDKGSVVLIKADGNHSVHFYKGDHLVDSDVIFEDKCRFRTRSAGGLDNGEDVTTYLQCSKSSVGEGIFEKITKLGIFINNFGYSIKIGQDEIHHRGNVQLLKIPPLRHPGHESL